MITQPGALDQLAERIGELERRVASLEERQPLEYQHDPATEPVAESPAVRPIAPSMPVESSPIGGALTVVGKALLGIAGAYVLRALSGSAAMPRFLVAALAVAYALAWLVAAARTVARHRLAGILYAATSALILTPMLWEMTLRFRVMPAWVAAVIVTAFAAVAAAFAHRTGGSPVFFVAYAGSAVTALALLIGTHDMAPFAVILLAMLAGCEFGNTSHRAPAIRYLIAFAADLAVWSILFIYRTPPATRTDYPSFGTAALVAAPLLLFAIQAVSVAAHAGIGAQRISALEAIQAIIALLLAACGILWFLPGPSQLVLGALCLVLSAACYGTAFSRSRSAADPRNFRIFTAWGGILLLCGISVAVSNSLSSALFGCAAIAAIVLGRRLQSSALEFHGVFYLAVAAAFSGLIVYAFQALAGAMPPSPGWPLLVVAGCSLIAYGIASESPGESWPRQFVHLIPALLAACALAALLTRAAVGLATLFLTPDVSHIALVRTLILCCVAMGLAYGGVRLHRLQMTHVAYAVTAFVAAKLLFEDLRHGHMEFIAASICVVALTLIAVPRLARGVRPA